ncbi:MAG: UDP-N-acetylmuramoyl-L-alanine--D-glutamate ligase [Betaproteobacteria bacterium]|nr:UDP-N-acetylmuramoyl-L-alanine--D-glutamate ligase [Betaproteobacteria bacterium]
MDSLRDQHVLILGLGASGLAMARWCARNGTRVRVLDTRAAPPQAAALQAQVPQAHLVHGNFSADAVQGSDIRAVFVSPGLAPADTAPLVDAARSMGLWVGGELSLFAHALADLHADSAYAPCVLAITGTNGKTTVTALTGQLIARAGKTVAVAGNIGPTLLDTLAQALDAQALPEVWVLELSSFQLHHSGPFEPTAAVVLNLSQDHLDWHSDMDDYAAAKARVFGTRAAMVLNRDDAAVMAMAPAPAAKVKARPGAPKEATAPARTVLSFGSDLPTRIGDLGLEDVNGLTWLVRAVDSGEKVRRGDVQEILIQRLMPADALRIRGRHNATNALAALALVTLADCPLAPVLYGLREYRGEPHRMQSVAVIDGVEFFDDSKGTNVGATVAALTGLGAERQLVVILGGDGKGQDFAPLAAPLAAHARAVVLIGRDAHHIRSAIANSSALHILDADSLPQAVEMAAQHARSGDAVLLSPACASFDMFDDYTHRARVFVESVATLAQRSGKLLEAAA